VLADAAHGGDAVAKAAGDRAGAPALVAEFEDALAHGDRDGSHATTLPQLPSHCRLHYLWKCSGGKNTWASPMLANGRSYLRNLDKLAAFDASEKSLPVRPGHRQVAALNLL